MRSFTCVLAVCFCFALLPSIAAGEAPAWREKDEAAYIVVDGRLFDLSGEPREVGPFDVNRVAGGVVGRPALVVELQQPDEATSLTPTLGDYATYGLFTKRINVMTPLMGGEVATTSFVTGDRRSETPAEEQPLLAADFRRTVRLKDGDLHRGVFDWATGEIVSETKVTDLGILKTRPFLLHGNIALLYGGFDQDKPIVRVDLVTGDVQEWSAEHLPIYKRNSKARSRRIPRLSSRSRAN